eukprot:GEMP01038396.1.p1 GENE.GEMP01038396.1~~GEMP01038396.1.p1  ORF type:complete len:247 (+),score=51.44 GEMP01038396.1:183-923(+)
MATNQPTLQLHQTSAHKYGALQKKSPSAFAGWQRRHCVLLVDRLLYFAPSKSGGGEAGELKGAILLNETEGIHGRGDTVIIISHARRAYVWKAASADDRYTWLECLQRARAIALRKEPQITKELLVSHLAPNDLVGISLLKGQVAAINYPIALAHGWQLGDVVVKVGSWDIADQKAAMGALKNSKPPFTVVVKRYDHASAGRIEPEATMLEQPRDETAASAQGNDELDADDSEAMLNLEDDGRELA